MYKNFFGLTRNPFELSPDPSFICPSEKHSEALSLIGYAISQRKGFVALTGEAGTGKTLMLRCLFETWRREGIAFANIFAPRLSVIDFLTYAAADLGIETAEQTKGNLLRAFYAFVSAQCAKGLTTVLVIDEAHQAPAHVLEEIRMLTNVETNEEKLVQVLLVGQPELDDKLDSFELRQLKQRIAIRCQLEPLGEQETRQYIEQRLRIAGADPSVRKIFPAELIRNIHRYSRGIPRVVNSLCDQSLVVACTRRLHVVPVEIVDEVAARFRLVPPSAPKDATAPGTILTYSAGPSNSASALGENASHSAGQQSEGIRGARPTVVVEAVWRTWPALLKRTALIAGAATVLVGLSLGGVALFHHSPKALAYSAPNNAPSVPVPAPQPQASDPAGAAAAPLVKSALPTPLAKIEASAAPKLSQPESKSSTPANDPVEVAPVQRRTIVSGNLSRPILRSRSVPNSNSAEPVLGAAENTSPSIDIHSLDATLNGPSSPVGGHLKEAKLISSPPPVYPDYARSEGAEGVVVIDALVDTTGKVKDMKVISGPKSLVGPAMDALRRWKYEPARLNDQPIEVHQTVHINFSIH